MTRLALAVGEIENPSRATAAAGHELSRPPGESSSRSREVTEHPMLDFGLWMLARRYAAAREVSFGPPGVLGLDRANVCYDHYDRRDGLYSS